MYSAREQSNKKITLHNVIYAYGYLDWLMIETKIRE